MIQWSPLYIVQLTNVDQEVLLEKVELFDGVMLQRRFFFEGDGVIDVVVNNNAIIDLRRENRRSSLVQNPS